MRCPLHTCPLSPLFSCFLFFFFFWGRFSAARVWGLAFFYQFFGFFFQIFSFFYGFFFFFFASFCGFANPQQFCGGGFFRLSSLCSLVACVGGCCGLCSRFFRCGCWVRFGSRSPRSWLVCSSFGLCCCFFWFWAWLFCCSFGCVCSSFGRLFFFRSCFFSCFGLSCWVGAFFQAFKVLRWVWFGFVGFVSSCGWFARSLFGLVAFGSLSSRSLGFGSSGVGVVVR